MLLDGYKTEIGMNLLVPHKTTDIEKFIAYGDNSYDFRLQNYELAIITGKNEIERNLPILKLPLVIDNTIVLDMRENVRVKPGFIDLDEILNIRSDYMLKFYTISLIDKAKTGLDEWRDTYIKLAQIAYTNVLSNTLILDQDDKRILNGLITLLAVTSYDKEKDLDTRIMIAQNNTIGDALSDSDYHNLLKNSDGLTTISDLISILNSTHMVGRRLSKITDTKLYSTLSSIVFRANNAYAMTGLEYPISLISLMLLYGTNSLYKKSSLAFGLKSFHKLLKIESRVKEIDRDIKDMLPFG